MQTTDAIQDLAAALAKAQGEFLPAMKAEENEAFKRGGKFSKYADIAAVWEAVRKPLSANGLSVIQQAARVEGGVAITTRLMHGTGQWIQFEPLVIPMSKSDAHGIGSATTYGRRFSLCAALGIVADADDDGNEAAGKTTRNAEPEQEAPVERQMTKAQARPEYDKLVKEIQAQPTVTDLEAWGKRNKSRLDAMPADWQMSLKNEYSDHKSNLMNVAAQ